MFLSIKKESINNLFNYIVNFIEEKYSIKGFMFNKFDNDNDNDNDRDRRCDLDLKYFNYIITDII